MAEPTIEGCREKWARGTALANHLVEKAREYETAEPLAYTLNGEWIADRREFVWTGEIVRPLNDAVMWAVILGDVVHNWRSALDHLVWQLVALDAKKDGSTDHQFPIASSGSAYWSRTKGGQDSLRERRLRHISDRHKIMIDRLQPYRTNGPGKHRFAAVCHDGVERGRMSTDRSPKWNRPAYYGHPAAIDAMGTVAAPFLAGIGIALAVLVISNETHFGWAGEALFALVSATVAFIACVECAFVARQYVVKPSELEEWLPGGEPNRIVLMEAEQRLALATFLHWAAWARRAYNCGIVAFAVGVAALMVPPTGLGHADAWRVAVFLLAVAGLIAELAAILITMTRSQEAEYERQIAELP